MPSGFIQTIITQVQEIVDRPVGVVNEKNTVIACSDLSQIGTVKEINNLQATNLSDVFTDETFTYQIFKFQPTIQYMLFVEGVDEISLKFVNFILIMLKNAKKHYDEKNNKNEFIRNIVLNNILPNDIYVKAREFNLKAEVLRATFLIKVESTYNSIAYDILNDFFIKKNRDFIFNVNSNEIVLIKEVKDLNSDNSQKIAEEIFNKLKSKINTEVFIGFSSQVDNIKKLEQSFKEANVALNVSEIFNEYGTIVGYNNLGIFRIIYQLPATLCEIFLKEVFKKKPLESLDVETFSTIYSFFENNLNVSETSKKLFIHRNTLVYRLEKIKRLTGLDLRKFEDAIIFKIAIMVKKYLKFNLNKK